MTNSSPMYQRRDPSLSFVRDTVHAFMGEGWRDVGQLDFTYVDRLCEWAVSADSQVAKAATAAIFGGIIEQFCDDFSDEGVTAGNLVLSRILQWLRVTPQGAELDCRLNDFGFADGDALLQRYLRVSQPRQLGPDRLDTLRKVFVLSRVTAGADIAITSVIVHRLRKRLPHTELVLIGPGHLVELFASVADCRYRDFVYKNDGGLFVKMTSWPRLLEVVAEECEGLSAHEVLLFDPDTRLSQLGLLPLLPGDNTCYFPSRFHPKQEFAGCNLSVLTNEWLNLLLDEKERWQPSIVFPSNGEDYHSFVQSLYGLGCRLVVTVNFGVGNDPRKRVHDEFETGLVSKLLGIPGTVVILDTGRGEQKEQWVTSHFDSVLGLGLPAVRLAETELQGYCPAFGHGLIVFTGVLGSLGKMIDAGDCFVGYDSCGQHLAAATRTPAVIIFSGAPSQRFIQRWSPDVPGSITIPIRGSVSTNEATELLIQTVIRAVAEIRDGRLQKENYDFDKE
ncbi:MAG: hypothetical protein KKD63_04910 [Proteobacteria bacterium]|nr:hypothetical protein [Desulfobulbaceae bacterium]MBU4152202.1 hypothetical protein [Pseudomonadota bacterium]